MSRHDKWKATPALLARIALEINEEARLRAQAERINPIKAVLKPLKKEQK